ncbi:MAG: hypothetical protein Q8Q25_01200 [bacterium]|nr:hypothetical protein [bacterium]
MKKRETFVQAITDILVKHKVITLQEGNSLQKGFKESSQEIFDDFLLEEGLVDDINILRALAEHYQVPAFDVVGYFFDYNQLHKFPKDFLLRNAIIPLEVDENIMIIVASEPDNPELLARIGEYVSYDIQFRVGLKRDICDAVKEFYDKAPTEVEHDEDIKEELRERSQVKLEESGKQTVSYENEVYDREEEIEEELEKYEKP